MKLNSKQKRNCKQGVLWSTSVSLIWRDASEGVLENNFTKNFTKVVGKTSDMSSFIVKTSLVTGLFWRLSQNI